MSVFITVGNSKFHEATKIYFEAFFLSTDFETYEFGYVARKFFS
jgi:hypothetical protein